jgi:hypothetical protein
LATALSAFIQHSGPGSTGPGSQEATPDLGRNSLLSLEAIQKACDRCGGKFPLVGAYGY